VEGRRVHVFAEAAILEKRRDQRYVWGLRIWNGPDRAKLLLDRPYIHQPFTVLAGRATPTFEETLELGPGQYVVEVRLHEVPSRAEIAMLKDREFADSHRVFAGAKPAVIGQ
jgi:hypothetical protein